MQSQGLEALMQSQPAPQMNNPRLAAAMDVVTSDAEEQILDPRTLAMLKYKDALQAMQAADQMIASAQPAPTPPTVAERTKLAAEQGIAGLAQRLSPGVQQRGGQMAAQQAQQAMQGGGLPQLSAPNMAGMAGGGIVAFADGGAPTPTKVVPRPVPMGQPSVETQAAVSDDVARYIYNYTNLRASMEAATDPQQKAVINQRLQEMQRTFSPDIVSEAHMKMSQQSGMADGGAVRGFAEGKQVQGAQPVGFTPTPPREGLPASLEELLAERKRYDRIKAEAERIRNSNQPQTQRARMQQLIDAGVPPDEALQTALSEALLRGQGPMISAADIPTQAPQASPAQATAEQVPPAQVPPAQVPPAERASASPVSDIDALINALSSTGSTNVSTPLSSPYQEYEEAMMGQSTPEDARAAAEARHNAAMGPSTEELKALVRSRSAALDAPLYTPEEERNRKISALLRGLASSNLIAQSGPAASAGLMAVQDAVREDARDRAQKQFELASGLIQQDRTAAGGALAAGEGAFGDANTQRAQVYQSLIARFNSANEIEAARTLASEKKAFDTIQIQLEAELERDRQGLLSEQNKVALSTAVTNRLQDADAQLTALIAQQPLMRDDPTAVETLNAAIEQQQTEIADLRAKSSELFGVSGGVIDYKDL